MTHGQFFLIPYLYMCDGFNSGFDTMISNTSIPIETLECKDLLSAITEPENVDKLVIPTSKYFKTPWLIVDLSSPHDNEHVSVNFRINKEDCSYQTCMLR